MEIRGHRHQSLKSDRLLLRELKESDVEDMFEWTSDDKVTKFLTWPTHQNIEVTKEILSKWLNQYETDPTCFRFGIVLRSEKKLIGNIDVVSFENDCPEIGYCLNSKYWNQGYMSEALKVFCDYLFTFNIRKIIIAADKDNIASNKVIKKNGFVFTHESIKNIKNHACILNYYELIK